MTLWDRFVTWFWRRAQRTEGRRRYLRAPCEVCGRIIARTSKGTWRHQCRPSDV